MYAFESESLAQTRMGKTSVRSVRSTKPGGGTGAVAHPEIIATAAQKRPVANQRKGNCSILRICIEKGGSTFAEPPSTENRQSKTEALLIGRLSELVLGVDDTHVVLIVATEGTFIAQGHFNVVADFGSSGKAGFNAEVVERFAVDRVPELPGLGLTH